MNRKRLTMTVLVLLSLGTIIGVYAGTVGVNNLFGFDNITADVEYYRNGVNYTQFIASRYGSDQSLNTTDAVTFTEVNSNEYFLGPVNITDMLTYPEQSASYILFTDGVNYFAKNGATGAIDYSGTNATTVIQSTLNGLTVGRTWKEKILLKGNFTVDKSLVIYSYTILEIQGVLSAANGLNSSLILNNISVGVNAYVDPGTPRDTDIEIFGGIIDGNKNNQGNPTDDKCTILMQGVNDLSIHHIKLINGWTEAIRTAFCDHVDISHNVIDNSADDGIAINKETYYAIVSNNLITNTGQGVTYGAPYGIEIEDNSKYISIIGNTVNNSLTGNIGIVSHGGEKDSVDITIQGNVLNGSSVSMSIVACNRTTISGNTISGASSANAAVILSGLDIIFDSNLLYDSTGGRGISVTGTGIIVSNNVVSNGIWYGVDILGNYNLVIGNKFLDNDIGIGSHGDNNTIETNICTDTSAPIAQRYGIYIYPGSDNNKVYANTLYSNTVNQLVDTGANNEFRNNLGYITENSGLDTLYNLTSSVTVAHGLGYTPTADEFSITFTSSLANVTQWWISGIGAANFDLNVGDAGAAKLTSTNITFGWSVNRQ